MFEIALIMASKLAIKFNTLFEKSVKFVSINIGLLKVSCQSKVSSFPIETIIKSP